MVRVSSSLLLIARGKRSWLQFHTSFISPIYYSRSKIFSNMVPSPHASDMLGGERLLFAVYLPFRRTSPSGSRRSLSGRGLNHGQGSGQIGILLTDYTRRGYHTDFRVINTAMTSRYSSCPYTTTRQGHPIRLGAC
jgi:hypothetical protein